MEDSHFEFASSNLVSSTPLTATGDWTLYYSSDSLSDLFNFENLNSHYNGTVKTFDSISPKVKEFTSYEPESSSSMSCLFKSPMQYENCFDHEQHDSDSAFKSSVRKHNKRVNNGASVLTDDNTSDFHENVCYTDENAALASPYAKSSENDENTKTNTEKEMSDIHENKSVLINFDDTTNHENFVSEQCNMEVLNSDKNICLSPSTELFTTLEEDNCLPSHSASISNKYVIFRGEKSNCDNAPQPEKEEDPISHEISTSSTCLESMKLNQTFEGLSKSNASEPLSMESLEKSQISETDHQAVENLTKNNNLQPTLHSICSSDALSNESLNESRISETNHQGIENLTKDSNLEPMFLANQSSGVLSKESLEKLQISEKDHQALENLAKSISSEPTLLAEQFSEALSMGSLKESEISESVKETVLDNHQLGYDNHAPDIDKYCNILSAVSELEFTNESNSVNSEMNSNKCEKDVSMENFCEADMDIAPEVATSDTFETAEQPIDFYFLQLLDSFFEDKHLIGEITGQETLISSDTIYPEEYYQNTACPPATESTTVSGGPQISKSENCSSNDFNLNTNLMYCEKPVENNFSEIEEKSRTDIHDHAIKSTITKTHLGAQKNIHLTTRKDSCSNMEEDLLKVDSIEETKTVCDALRICKASIRNKSSIQKNEYAMKLRSKSEKNGMKNGSELPKIADTHDHALKSNSDVKNLLDLLEVDSALSERVFLTLLQKYMKNGMTQGKTLNYIVKALSPESVFEFKEKFKSVWNFATDIGMFHKKNRRYFFSTSAITENHLDVQKNMHLTARKSKIENTELRSGKGFPGTQIERDIPKKMDLNVGNKSRILEDNCIRYKAEIQKNKCIGSIKNHENSKLKSRKVLSETTNIETISNLPVKARAGNKLEIPKNKHVGKRKNEAENNDLKKEEDLLVDTIKETESDIIKICKSSIGSKSRIQKNEYTIKLRSKSGNELPKIVYVKSAENVIPLARKLKVGNESETDTTTFRIKRKFPKETSKTKKQKRGE